MERNEGQATKWMTVRQCAVYLGLTERAIYNHVHRGTLPFQKLGTRVFFDALEIDSTIRSSLKKRSR